MYVNQREEINYHGFVGTLREMNKVSQEVVSQGICSVSGMNRFENGNRAVEKLVRDRLTARMGISGERYEEYLRPKEYVIWEHRIRIVKAIEKKNLELAKSELAAYEQRADLNCVNEQFVEAMRYMILNLEGAHEDELEACIQRAVECTVPNVSNALEGAHLLADQEVNLIAEQIRVGAPKEEICDVNTWRISEYEKLLSYIGASRWEKLQKVKIYPKVAYYICQILLEKEATETECRRGLELCHTAMELLYDTKRLYYFVELTETRRELLARLSNCGISVDEQSYRDEMFTELYTKYGSAPRMSDFCYLYYENACHNMAKVLETRRNMMGLSRAKLSKEICSERAIIRFEREGLNPSIEVARRLFERLGLCGEYRRALIVTTDVDALIQYEDLLGAINGLKEDEIKTRLAEVLDRIDSSIPFNQQELGRLMSLLDFKQNKITRKELTERMVDALEITLPIKALKKGMKQNAVYTTRAELSCLYDIAFYGEGEASDLAKSYIDSKCNVLLENE